MQPDGDSHNMIASGEELLLANEAEDCWVYTGIFDVHIIRTDDGGIDVDVWDGRPGMAQATEAPINGVKVKPHELL